MLFMIQHPVPPSSAPADSAGPTNSLTPAHTRAATCPTLGRPEGPQPRCSRLLAVGAGSSGAGGEGGSSWR
jgi:hypothetical protein